MINERASPPLTPAQRRLLARLNACPRWHTLTELDQTGMLQEDDVLTVPSLIELGLICHFAKWHSVAITTAGEAAAQEFRR